MNAPAVITTPTPPIFVSTVYLCGETRRREWECEFTVRYRFDGEEVTEIVGYTPDQPCPDFSPDWLENRLAEALVDDCIAQEAYAEWECELEDMRADALADDAMLREWVA